MICAKGISINLKSTILIFAILMPLFILLIISIFNNLFINTFLFLVTLFIIIVYIWFKTLY